MSVNRSEFDAGRSAPAPHGAVFLSYAREDAACARRIAEALRAAGLEVWFDENELRGGDAWDQKLRRQIRECTLFLPVISAQTQARHEGYFRREWKFAVERMGDMAAGTAFLVPVVVDGTREADALVPEEFMRVQWTRLPGALPTPQFVEQAKRLLAAPRGANAGRGLPTPPEPPRAEATFAAGSGDSASQKKKAAAPAVLALSLGVVVVSVGVVLFLALRGGKVDQPGAGVADPGPAAAKPAPTHAAAPASSAPSPAPPPTPTVARPAVAEKSIAVLPFANMSEEKENAFFTDGVHEDILTNLALIRDLKVVSRTTVLRYRDSKKTVREIGDELGVAYVLEGSVRRAGGKVRVTGQLIRTRTDEHVWAKAYDRDLTDIFAIQAALAQEIAGALQAAISPETQKHLARRPTDNPAAYDFFLRGRDIRNRAPTASREALDQSERFFQSAAELDPNFAAAWGELAIVHALRVFWEIDATVARKERGDAAIAQATLLAADAPDVIRLAGTYAYYAYRDYDRATAAYRRIIALQPNDAAGYASLGLILRRQGRWSEAIAMQQRAVELDPANITHVRNWLSTLRYVRRWPEAEVAQQRLLALLPGNPRESALAAWNDFSATGSTAAWEKWVAALPPAERETSLALFMRKQLAVTLNDYPTFSGLDAAHQDSPEFQPRGISQQVAIAMHVAHRQPDRAKEVARLLRAESEAAVAATPTSFRGRLGIAFALAVLDETDRALEALRQIDEILPVSRDAIDSMNTPYFRAAVWALAGRKAEAVSELARYHSRPSALTVHDIRADPVFRATLGDYKPFQALLADPKNHAPLF